MDHRVEMTADCVCVSNLLGNRSTRFAMRGRECATGMKAATGWSINWIGRFALQNDAPRTLGRVLCTRR